MTSVDLMSAPAVWPLRSCISRAASEVMMEVICWSPILRTTWAEQATDFDFGDGADELIAAADVAEAFAGRFAGGGGFGFHERVEGALRDAVVAAGGLDGLEGAGEDPLFERGIADIEGGGGFAGFEQDVDCGHGFDLLKIS